MNDVHPRRAGTILGVATGGVLLGHWLTYRLDVPDAHARAGVLAATGHGYLGVAAQVAAVAAAIGVAMVFLGRLTRRDPILPFRSIAVRLAVVQGAAFVAMEVLERIGSGGRLHDLTAILAIGFAAQALVAVAGACIVRCVLRAADAAGSLADGLTVTPSGAAFAVRFAVSSFHPTPAGDPVGARDPPSSS